MKKFYITTFDGSSGIAKYSYEFFRLILRDRGYTYVTSTDTIPNILSRIGSRDRVHIEIGIFQKKEIELLMVMLKANYKHISVTLHDAPLLKYPFFEFENSLMNGISKLIEIYGNSFGAAKQYLSRLKAVYVLSRKGLDAVRKKYELKNVYFLPHVVEINEKPNSGKLNANLIFFGFIGRNKGLEYALQLHEKLIEKQPDAKFYVVGKPMGKELVFYEQLKLRYSKNVEYLGYVKDSLLSDVFEKATFALIPFKNYRFFHPTSGSILYSLKQEKIVLTNNVNTIPEIIKDGKTGIFLSNELKQDMQAILNILEAPDRVEQMRKDVRNFLVQYHSPDLASANFKD